MSKLANRAQGSDNSVSGIHTNQSQPRLNPS